jgi:hypothetical protein
MAFSLCLLEFVFLLRLLLLVLFALHRQLLAQRRQLIAALPATEMSTVRVLHSKLTQL